MKRAAVYARVATTDQRVESQLYDLRQLAGKRGLEIVQEYADKGLWNQREASGAGCAHGGRSATEVFGLARGVVRPRGEEHPALPARDR